MKTPISIVQDEQGDVLRAERGECMVGRARLRA